MFAKPGAVKFDQRNEQAPIDTPSHRLRRQGERDKEAREKAP
jgi:hypothetical protein